MTKKKQSENWHSLFADRSHAHSRRTFHQTFTSTMRQLWPNQKHAVYMDLTMSKRTIHNTAAAAIILWSLAMCLTIDIALCANLAGDIFQQFGSVATYRMLLTYSFSIFLITKLANFLSLSHLHFGFECRMENYVALKVIKSAQHYTETAADEIRLLEAIRMNETKHPYCEKIVKLLNHFTIRGVNGVHTCLVFEALGCSLYKLIVKNNFQGLPKKLVKSIIKQVRLIVSN